MGRDEAKREGDVIGDGALNIVKPFVRKPADGVIDVLKKALTQAKDGEITGIVLLTESETGVAYHTHGLRDRYQTSGILFHALYKLQSDS